MADTSAFNPGVVVPAVQNANRVWNTSNLDWEAMTQPGSSGGGADVQYADGVTQSTPTGNAILGKNSSNVLHTLSIDGSGNLNVNLAAGSISGGNAAASPTGSAVPASADYTGFNSGGNLVGVSTSNPLPVAQQGSVAVTGTFWQATQPVSLASMPTTPVTGTFWQATQPVSLAALPALATGANTIGAVNVNGTVPVSGTFWQATQPVSIASMPSTPVTGTFWQATQPVSGTITANAGTGSFTVAQATAANLNATVTGTVAATQSGTWNIGSVTTLPALVAGSATIGSVKLTDGTSTATIGNLTNNKALATMIVDGTGTQITSFGGGTQYAQGTTQASPTGTVAMAKNPSNVINALSTDASGYLYVNVAAGGGGGSNAAASATGSAVPASASYTSWNSGGNNTGVSLTTALPVQPGTGATFPVSGTFWQATQPVSLGTIKAASTAAVAADTALVVAISPNNTVAVSGTFWQATQPVSLATAPALVASSATIGGVKLIDTAGTNVGTIKAASTAAVAADTALVVAVSPNNTVATSLASLPALVAGSALIGKVGIDQTTVGTTNAVSLAQIGATTVVTGGVAGTLAVGGVTAAAASSTGNPVRIGGIGYTSNPTAVTTGQVTNLMTDKMGRPVVVQGQIRDLVATQATTITSTTATTIVTAGAAGVFNDITSLTITNSSATATIVTLTGGATTMLYSIAAGGGMVCNYSPPLPAASAATAWTLTLGTAVTSIYVAVVYIKNL